MLVFSVFDLHLVYRLYTFLYSFGTAAQIHTAKRAREREFERAAEISAWLGSIIIGFSNIERETESLRHIHTHTPEYYKSQTSAYHTYGNNIATICL